MLALFALPALAQTVALVQINQQALFFNEMNRGAEQAAQAAGAELVIFNANNDPAAQNNAIETYVQQGVDALIVVRHRHQRYHAGGAAGGRRRHSR